MPAPEPWVYILEGSPQYDNAGTMEERKVRFFSGSQVDGLLSTGAKAHIGLSQQLSATVAVDHPLIGGSAARGTTFGEITISWGGGDRDALFLPPYYWRGWPVKVLRIRRDAWPGPTGFEDVFAGVVEDVYFGRNSISLVIRDEMLALEQRLQQRVYAGTGTGVAVCEGGADLKDVPVPVLLGTCKNISPVLVDATALIYQFHDGDFAPAQAVSGVFDRGGALGAGIDLPFATFISGGGAPLAGYYTTCLASGLIRLGLKPSGTLTMDAQGDAESDGGGTPAFTDLWNKLVYRCAVGYGGLATAKVDSAILSLAGTSPVGFYSGTEPVLVREVIRQLAESGYGFACFDGTGVMRAGYYPWASSPAATVYDWQVIDLKMERTPMPASEVRIGHTRAWTVQDPESLVDALAPRAALVSQAYRYEQATIAHLDKFPLAKSRTFESLLSTSGGATAVQIAASYPQTGGWRRATLRCRGHQLARKPGDIVAVKHDRYGLASGRNALVMSVTENLADPEEVTTLGIMFPRWG